MVQLSPTVRSAVDEVKTRLIAGFGDKFDRMIVFGSQARGTAEPGSDVDLCIVLRSARPQPEHRDHVQAIDIVSEVSLDRLVELAPLVLTDQQFARYIASEHPLVRNIQRDGVPA